MSDPTTSFRDRKMSCDQVMRQDIAERYVLGKLDEADRDAFEEHYFECNRCYEEVQAYQLIEKELAPPEASRAKTHSRSWGWPAVAAAGVLLAVSVWLAVSVSLREPERPQSLPPVAEAPSPATAVPQPTRPSLEQLAAVTPPAYRPLTLRGPQDEARRVFISAMKDYQGRDFEKAIPLLERAERLDPDATDVKFFLGACYLLTGATDRAIQSLSRAIARGDSPYLEEAHFYLAKARLRQRDLTGAEAELRKTIQLKGDREREARDLLAQMKTLAR